MSLPGRILNGTSSDMRAEFGLGQSQQLAKYGLVIPADRPSRMRCSTGRSRQAQRQSRCNNTTLFLVCNRLKKLSGPEVRIPQPLILRMLCNAGGYSPTLQGMHQFIGVTKYRAFLYVCIEQRPVRHPLSPRGESWIIDPLAPIQHHAKIAPLLLGADRNRAPPVVLLTHITVVSLIPAAVYCFWRCVQRAIAQLVGFPIVGQHFQ